ncbi:hypothetical protein HZ994_08430 [Akkermansiaceae bacterium]|nr:hypothetical protein HZ994_08430 [Akkermansiaceae bacterium]
MKGSAAMLTSRLAPLQAQPQRIWPLCLRTPCCRPCGSLVLFSGIPEGRVTDMTPPGMQSDYFHGYCRFIRPPCACVFVMKKHLITLIVAVSAVIHAQAADLASQRPGYWKPDMEKTLALAKKANREMDELEQAMMGAMVVEFQKDKMFVHGPPGLAAAPPLPYKLTAVDEAANSLTLSAGGKEMNVRFDKGQMALNDPESGWTIFNRMSKEDFAKRGAGGERTEAEGGENAPAAGKIEDISAEPIPDTPAAGKVHGKEFKVEKATLNSGVGTLKLQQGEGLFGDMQFTIFLFDEGQNEVDGKTITVKPNQGSTTAHIHMSRMVEKGRVPQNDSFTGKFAMKLEFGTAKDDKIPGKIHLRVPDEAGSFVSGTFEAEIK